MDIKKIKTIIDLVKKSGIAEIEIADGEEKIRISNFNQNNYSNPIHYSTIDSHMALENNQFDNTKNKNQLEDNAPKSSIDELNVITSPMVGTFYSASSPTSKAFVELGQEVKVGQILCIIEAMKLMNQIESDKSGVIKEVLVIDGSPVEFGQPLFVIE